MMAYGTITASPSFEFSLPRSAQFLGAWSPFPRPQRGPTGQQSHLDCREDDRSAEDTEALSLLEGPPGPLQGAWALTRARG